jgi:hypothetical protein
VRIPPALVADLGLLTDALDQPGTDVAATLAALASDAAASVNSYLGLTVRMRAAGADVEVTTLLDQADAARVRSSLRIPLGAPDSPEGRQGDRIDLVLFAATPGAFVDLAADLAWLTGRPMDDARLDHDVAGPFDLDPSRSLRARSSIDQALGVLIGGGLTSEQASSELDALAARDGVLRHQAAHAVLAALTPRDRPVADPFV